MHTISNELKDGMKKKLMMMKMVTAIFRDATGLAASSFDRPLAKMTSLLLSSQTERASSASVVGFDTGDDDVIQIHATEFVTEDVAPGRGRETIGERGREGGNIMVAILMAEAP